MVRSLTGRLGRSGVSWRSRVDRVRRACGFRSSVPLVPVVRVRLPRMPVLASSSSSSPISASRSAGSSPASAAWPRRTWARARRPSQNSCSPSGGGLWVSGSPSRCQPSRRCSARRPCALFAQAGPSRHCSARRPCARFAQAGQSVSRVAPHGTRTWVTSPVSRLVRRSWTGRMQPPRLTAAPKPDPAPLTLRRVLPRVPVTARFSD